MPIIPQTPIDFNRHVLKNVSIQTIWKYINNKMLLGKHLGISGKIIEKITSKDYKLDHTIQEEKKAFEILSVVEHVKQKYEKTHFIPQAIFQFFECNSKNNDIILYPTGTKEVIINFPRQKKDNGLSIADYILPITSNQKDSISMFIVSVGKNIRQEVEKLKSEGKYLESHIIAALALESAEAMAEWLHEEIRRMWGIKDRVDLSLLEKFQAKYQGKRYSFGYPACPDLNNQKLLFDLLKPEAIGVSLTEEMMMEPEASVSAIVVYSKEAQYFSI